MDFSIRQSEVKFIENEKLSSGEESFEFTGTDQQDEAEEFLLQTSLIQDGLGSPNPFPKDFFGPDFQLMSILNRLYDVLKNVEGPCCIHLPRLVVCGDQSAGKKSVLEGIVRKEFLPRGEDIQTRCPIEIRLIRDPHQEEGYAEVYDEYTKSWHRFGDLALLKHHIQAKTNSIKNSSPAGVSDEQMTIRICSAQVPNLTLVDLPGFLSVKTDDQDESIVAKIQTVVRKEIGNTNSIILAVTAANNNIGTSRALQEALQVDQNRERTLGILTKLDLMDKGTQCGEILKNKRYKLKLGWIGVVDRGFEDNMKGVSIDQKLDDEEEFLEVHYPTIFAQNGTRYLTRRISDLLLHKIYESLPAVKGRIEWSIHKNRMKLEALGKIEIHEQRKQKVIEFLEDFCNSYSAQIEGTRRNINTSSSSASFQIQRLYEEFLVNDKLDILEDVTDDNIDLAIRNSYALHTLAPMSVDDAFQHLAKKEIQKLRNPIRELAERVNNVMIQSHTLCQNQDAEKYPKINKNISLVASKVIRSSYDECMHYLEKFICAEESMIYSAEEKFLEKLKTTMRDMPNYEKFVKSDIAAADRALVKTMILNYVDMVKRRVRDHCPKAISHLLVYDVLGKIRKDLISTLYFEKNVDELMKETLAVEQDRDAFTKKIETYTRAKDIIDDVLKNAQA